MVLEKPLESPLDSKEIKPVNPKRNQPWNFIRRTDAEAEAPVLWPTNVKSQLIGKDPDAGKDCGQKENGQQDGIINSMDMSLSKPQDIVKNRECWSAAVHVVAESGIQLRDWTLTTNMKDTQFTPPADSARWAYGFWTLLTIHSHSFSPLHSLPNSSETLGWDSVPFVKCKTKTELLPCATMLPTSHLDWVT